ncbi:MAG: formate/nitrite transporter family protein [Lachnospiraceae bacterium]
MKSYEEIVDGYIELGVKKTKYSFKKIVLMGIIAGAFVALGAASSNAATHGISDIGIAKTVAGAIFPVGLLMIIFLGAELFTGDTMMFMGYMDKRFQARKMIKALILIYFSNFIGAVIIATLVSFSGQLDYSHGLLGAYTIKLAYNKVNLDFATAFTSGILCNILVCAAMLMASAAKGSIGKIFSTFFPIFAFIIGGYEHCIANMFYIPAGIWASLNSSYVELAMENYGLTAEKLAHLNVGGFLLNNLIPVTLGNLVGGIICVSIPLYIINKKSH